MQTAKQVLKRLEWSGQYSYCTGWPCCPICKGIKPEHGKDKHGVQPDNTGHHDTCALANVLKDNTMEFVTADTFPPEGEVVLARGWGEKKKYYIYALTQFERTRTGHRWEPDGEYGVELWFAPVEWTALPQPDHERR
mgnify:FL=1